MKPTYEGGCQCKRISFACNAEPVVHLACHCNDCRQATGADYSAIAFFKTSAVHLNGATDVYTFTAASGNKTRREYCENCGTVVFDKSDGFSGLTGIFSAQINTPKLLSPRIHVWVGSKLEHVQLSPKLKSYQQGLPKPQ